MEPDTQPPDPGADSILLADLPPHAVLAVPDLMRLFGRGEKSIWRAVERGELPQPVEVLGKHRWTVRMLVLHIEQRMVEAQATAEQQRKKNLQKIIRLERGEG